MIDNLKIAHTYVDIGATVYRVFAGVIIAVAGGLALGLVMRAIPARRAVL